MDGDMPPADPRPLGARTASFDSSLADVANLQISEGSKVRGSGSGDCGFPLGKVLPISGILRGGHRGREGGGDCLSLPFYFPEIMELVCFPAVLPSQPERHLLSVRHDLI